MKKKLYLLVVFIVIGISAQTFDASNVVNREVSNNQHYVNLGNTEPHKDVTKTTTKVLVQISINVNKETLHVRSTHAVEELSINNLHGTILIQKRDTNSIGLVSLPRGVYILNVKAANSNFSKKIILQ